MKMDLTVSEFIAKVDSGEFDGLEILGFAGMFEGARAVKPDKVCKEALIAALRQSLAEARGELRDHKVSLVVQMQVPDKMATAVAYEQMAGWGDYGQALYDNGFEMDEDTVELVCDRFDIIASNKQSRLFAAKQEYLAAMTEALQESVRGCWEESGITIRED